MRYLIIPCLFLLSFSHAQPSDEHIQQLLQDYRYDQVIQLLDGQTLDAAQELYLVKAYRQTGQSKIALEHLNKMWAKDSTNINVALALGETFYSRSQYRAAYQYFSITTLLDSTNGHYQKLAGKSASKVGALKPNALYHFQKALQIQPNDRNAGYQLAITYLDFGEVKMARTLSQSFVEKDSSDLGMMLLDTRLAYIIGSNEDVIMNVNFMFAQGDSIPSAIQFYGAALYKTKRYPSAKKWLKQSVTIAPSEQGYFFLGKSYNKLHQFDSAAYFMQQAIDDTKSPNLGEYYTHLALTLDNNRQDSEAIEAYDQAYALTENHDLLFRLALLHEDMRHVETARWYYQKFLDRTPDNPTDEREYAKTRLQQLKVAEFMDVDD